MVSKKIFAAAVTDVLEKSGLSTEKQLKCVNYMRGAEFDFKGKECKITFKQNIEKEDSEIRNIVIELSRMNVAYILGGLKKK